MANLALLDLVLPYVFRGENLGATHAALSVLRVVRFETAVDDLGIAVRGHCEVNGSLDFLPASGSLVAGAVDEAAPPYDPSASDAVFDLRDTSLDFELIVPRAGSAIVTAAQGQVGPGAPTTTAVLDDLAAAGSSDYPSTAFTLDLIVNAPRLRPPFLHPAKVGQLGVLEPDTSRTSVAITLPRLRLRFEHGNAVGSQLVLTFLSAGVSDLDDPGSVGVAQLISMDPPYAYLGNDGDHVIGMGFRSATLDLDGDWTPPALRDKAGVGDDWKGLYLPEVRLFVSPDGLQNLAFECGAQELLIGIDRTGGVWGDFEALLVQQGSAEMIIRPRFEADGHGYSIVRGGTAAGIEQATARVPTRSTMVVDVTGGRTPYTRQVKINGATQANAMTYDIDLGTTGTATVELTVTSGTSTAPPKQMRLQLTRLVEQPSLPPPGGVPSTDQLVARITTETGFDFDLDQLTGEQVTVRSVPPEARLVWSADANGTSPAAINAGPSTAYTTTVAAGTTRSFGVSMPGATGATTLDVYFFFDAPSGTGGTAMSTTPAVSESATRWTAGSRDPVVAYRNHYDALPNGTTITIVGDASFENRALALGYNTSLAWRRAMAVRSMIAGQFPAKGFAFVIQPALADPQNPTTAEQNAWSALVGWPSHGDPGRNQHWHASVSFTASTPATTGTVAVLRPATPPARTPVPPTDPPPPEESPPPDWFRKVGVKVRLVDSQLIALQLDLEVDINTMTEQKLQGAGTLPAGANVPRGRTLQRGTPVGPDNPADGITAMRVLVQTDPATGRWTTLLTVGADPADTDGLFHFGWVPQVDPMPANKDLGLTVLGSYLSFWPLLAQVPPVDAIRNAAEGREGGVVDATLSVAALAVPAVVAVLPWFAIERVILFGGELLHSQRQDGFTTNLLIDVEMDWSVDLLGLVTIPRTRPLKVRYKAIGLSLTNRDPDPALPPGAPPPDRWDFRPVFDATRGYTIDVASGGGMQIADPLGQILRILGARLSRSNPMTLEVDIGLGIDLGVVAIDQASVRAYLDGSAPPELTALAARIDIPGALAGSGYMRIANEVDSAGNTIGTIGGQLDLTLRPVSVRVCAAVEVATITEAATGRTATGVYIGLNVVLPAGIPLGSTGLGIFGFRGIFGMHYQRNAEIGAGTGVPALAWLRAAGGQPHLLRGPDLGGPGTGQILWKPAIDNWAFGIGILIGTMEGGVLINLDGTFLLELPGPRVLIMLNARIISPPPSVGELGMSGGVLAVIEITPEHFLIGLLISWEIEELVKIVIPVEAVFPFGEDSQDWHIYLGARRDYGPSVEVDVLGIVTGTGYLMFRGNGLNAFDNGHANLPAITGFGIGLGVAAGFTWGDVDSGLYLSLGGGMDAVLGFAPFTLAGNIWVAGELRLWIVSVGADASLTVIVAEQPPTTPGGDSELSLYIHGEACGHVSFLFFSVSGCVTIDISGPRRSSPIPALVEKVSLQSRSPALAQGSAVDRGVDTSLGEALQQPTRPAAGGDLPVVPIDAIPIVSMQVPPGTVGAVTVGGLGTTLPAAPGVGYDGYAVRGADRYRYQISAVRLERVKGNGQVDPDTLIGTVAPVVWWSIAPAIDANPAAQLALLTWKAAPATKAIEHTEHLTEDVIRRWGGACTPAAPAAEVLWTFELEPLGPSDTGWVLEGVAWPDPPGTQRSVPPQTSVAVSEPWRTGDPELDGLRGVSPAWVIGSTVECRRRDGGIDGGIHSGPLTHLPISLPTPRLRSDPDSGRTAPFRSDALRAKAAAARVDLQGLSATPTRSLSEMLARTRLREPIAAQDFTLALHDLGRLEPGTSDRAGTGAATSGKCPVKVLRAPMLDYGRPTNFPDPDLVEQLEAGGIGTEKRDLFDVVRISTGGFETFGLLLLVAREVAGRKTLVVRSVRADGTEINRVVVTSSSVLGSGATLPSRWADPTGPWGADVDQLVGYAPALGCLPAFVELRATPDAAWVEIGVTDPAGAAPRDLTHVSNGQDRSIVPAYHVAAVGLTSEAEVRRAGWDTTQIAADRTTVTQAVGPASSEHALLHPDSLYRIVVEWFADREGDLTPLGTPTSPQNQTFWFRTDTIAADPADPTRLLFTDTPDAVQVSLEPWTMMSLPDDNETGWFGREHVRLVFNTHDVGKLFTAYGKELRLRLEAANGEHPTGTSATPHPLPITAETINGVPAALLPPWEQALREAIERMPDTCLGEDLTRVTHGELDLDIPLHPFMGYLLDVECVDIGAAATARGPRIFRRHFTTGGFGTLDGFAASVATVRDTARFAEPGTFSSMLSGLGARPAGNAVDSHLMAHGVDPLGVPDLARVVVFWEQTGTALPQPAAIMIDATAPLSRSRHYPKKITDATTPDAASRWILADREWLTVRPGGDAGAVAGVVWAPGNQRAFVVLAAGARGKRVTADLVEAAMADLPFLNQVERVNPLVDLTLTHAPWEEV